MGVESLSCSGYARPRARMEWEARRWDYQRNERGRCGQGGCHRGPVSPSPRFRLRFLRYRNWLSSSVECVIYTVGPPAHPLVFPPFLSLDWGPRRGLFQTKSPPCSRQSKGCTSSCNHPQERRILSTACPSGRAGESCGTNTTLIHYLWRHVRFCARKPSRWLGQVRSVKARED